MSVNHTRDLNTVPVVTFLKYLFVYVFVCFLTLPCIALHYIDLWQFTQINILLFLTFSNHFLLKVSQGRILIDDPGNYCIHVPKRLLVWLIIFFHKNTKITTDKPLSIYSM